MNALELEGEVFHPDFVQAEKLRGAFGSGFRRFVRERHDPEAPAESVGQHDQVAGNRLRVHDLVDAVVGPDGRHGVGGRKLCRA